MQSRERTLGQKTQENLLKLNLNNKGDYIYLDDRDPTLFDGFADFLKWLEDKEAEIQTKEKEIQQKYGNEIVKRDEDGEVESINTDALVEMTKFRTNSYREAAERLNRIFGGDVLRKYFHVSYEINPDFVPDDECMYDFLEEIMPVMNELFEGKRERLETKYNKDRKGGKRNKYRNKDQIIQANM